MGFIAATTRVAANTSTGNQTISTGDLGGLTPKAVLLIATRATADGTAVDGAGFYIGSSDGTNELAQGYEEQHAQATMDSEMEQDTTANRILTIYDGTADDVVEGTANFVSFQADGVTIDWTDAPSAGYLITAYFFAGSDLSAHVGSVNLGNTADALIAVTNVGFEADVLITWLLEGTTTQHGAVCMGFVHNDRAGTVTQRAVSHSQRNAFGTSQVVAVMRDSDCIAKIQTTGSLDWFGTAQSFDSSGFDIQLGGGRTPNNTHMGWIALRFGSSPVVDAKVYTYSTPTSTGSNTDSGAGFKPQFVMYLANRASAADTIETDADGGAFGVLGVDADEVYTNSICSEDGAADSNTQSLSDDRLNLPTHTGASGQIADTPAFVSNGVSWNWTAVDGTARLWAALAIEEEAGGAISGSSAGTSTAAGTLMGEGTLAGTSSGAATTSATIEASGALAGTSAGVATVTGTMEAITPISGTADGSSSVTGTLEASGSLAGTSAGVASVTGTLEASGSLSGSSAGVASVTGTMEAVTPISGSSAGTSTASGTLESIGALSGSSSGTSTVSGTLEASGALSGASAGAATVTGTLTASGALSGSSAGTSTVTGTLESSGSLSGSSSGTSTVSGTLEAIGALSGLSAGTATVSGTLTGLQGDISGSSAGTSTVTGTLTGAGSLSGTSSGSSTVTGTLTAAGGGVVNGEVIALQYGQSQKIVWTEDFLSASPTWKLVNNIPSGTLCGSDVPYRTQTTMWICGPMGVYRSDNWQDASPTWVQKLTIAAATSGCGFTPRWNNEDAIADIAVSPVDSNYVYVVVTSESGGARVWVGKSTNNGDTWIWFAVDTSQPYGETGSIGTGYGVHHGCIVCSVNDANIATVGTRGDRFWKLSGVSTVGILWDGGEFWGSRGQIIQKYGAFDHLSVAGVAPGTQVMYGNNTTFNNASPTRHVNANRAWGQHWTDGVIYLLDHGSSGNTQSQPTVHKSTNNGQNYTSLGAFINSASKFQGIRMQRIAAFQGDSNKVVAASTLTSVSVTEAWVDEIQYSSNGGTSWVNKAGNMLSILPAGTLYGMGNGRIHWLDGFALDFSIQVTPPNRTIYQGECTTYEITVTSIGGFSDPVTLTIGGLPANSTYELSVNPVTPTGTSTLTICTTTATAIGTHIITVTGTSGDLEHEADTEITLIIDEPPLPPEVPCLITIPQPRSIAAYYYVLLRDWTGAKVALFDDWRALEYTNNVDDLGRYTFTINGNDSRRSLFTLDYIIEVWRSVPAIGVDWYCDFRGFHRYKGRITDSNGNVSFVSIGYDLKYLLSGRDIAYQAGTIRADKSSPAETAMKEYVLENCGAGSTVANGRLYAGVIPGFYTDASEGNGITWRGSRAAENVLDVLKEIASVSDIDFDVIYNGAYTFRFKTYPNQLGSDRTTLGLNPTTGMNAAGNPPVIFSVPMGTVSDLEYIEDHLSEANVVYVLGQGESPTRTIVTRDDNAAIAMSPLNQREISRPGSQEFTYQLEQLGDEVLKENAYKERLNFSPRQTPSLAYGKHYFVGDKVTASDDVTRDKRIVGATVNITNAKEIITVKFADIPALR